jgi:hypothetical protein
MPTGIPLPIILGGPSGSGKSTLGRHLDALGWLHCEADLRDHDGIDALDLRNVWETFLNDKDPKPLASELERKRVGGPYVRVILTLPSMPLAAEHLVRANGVLLIRFLSGPGWACFRNFTQRELAQGKRVGEGHWCVHNNRILDALNSPAYARHRLEAIRADGERIESDVLMRTLFDQSR